MQQVKVLIADDDAVIRMDLHTMLEELGHQVICEADNGETAYQMARNLKPGLVILDIMMPRMSGLEAAAAISRERLAPVLLLTAYSEASMIESATQFGVLAYLVKPFRKQELQPAIEIAVTRYRELCALEGELDSLREQMETRKIVGRAKAILMEREGIAEREAYRRLQAKSLSLNRPLREIAEAVILAEEINTVSR